MAGSVEGGSVGVQLVGSIVGGLPVCVVGVLESVVSAVVVMVDDSAVVVNGVGTVEEPWVEPVVSVAICEVRVDESILGVVDSGVAVEVTLVVSVEELSVEVLNSVVTSAVIVDELSV